MGLTFDVEKVSINNFEIKNLKIAGDVAWAIVVGDIALIDKGMRFDFERSRVSMVFEKVNGKWFISQWHTSVPQIGTEDKIGYPTVSDIQSKIASLIEELGINPNLGEVREEIEKYLAKAKSIVESLPYD
ncbi:MAG: nuclear transport factor 2 family protein [Candidatus Kariarchaeaceae archaeon]|jgi:hypothetical protein